MSRADLPIVITTPFIGQGGITNREWVNARMELFEMITFPSISKIMDSKIYWGIFMGENPDSTVESKARKIINGYQNIFLIEEHWNSENIVNFSLEVVDNENYITTAIADDDALNGQFFVHCRAKGEELLAKGTEHVGGSFANGLMWLMSETVDIDQFNANKLLVRKPVLVKYLFPWIGIGQFVLQTRSRPFRSMATTHMQFPQVLANEGFKVEVYDYPERNWLYNRHQLADSSLLKCNSRPLPFTNSVLEREFGIDSGKLSRWPAGEHGKIHCQKRAHRQGEIDMYVFENQADFVRQPYHLSFFESGKLVIRPRIDHNIQDRCRIRIYDEEEGEYFLLLALGEKGVNGDYIFQSSLFPGRKCRYDIQRWNGERWEKSLPAIKIMFSDYDEGLESLKTIKRMNDIFNQKMDKVNGNVPKSKKPPIDDFSQLSDSRTYQSDDGLWEIKAPLESNVDDEDDLSNEKFFTFRKDSIDLNGKKVRARITSRLDLLYSLEVIFLCDGNKNFQIHSSLIPSVEDAIVDFRFLDCDSWTRIGSKQPLLSVFY